MIPANNRLHGPSTGAHFLTLEDVLEEVLFDNARALVIEYGAQTRAVVLMRSFSPSPDIGSFRARACACYRVRTKGKVENGIAYVNEECPIADSAFASWEKLEAHLARWPREFANARIPAQLAKCPWCALAVLGHRR